MSFNIYDCHLPSGLILIKSVKQLENSQSLKGTTKHFILPIISSRTTLFSKCLLLVILAMSSIICVSHSILLGAVWFWTFCLKATYFSNFKAFVCFCFFFFYNLIIYFLNFFTKQKYQIFCFFWILRITYWFFFTF